MQANLLQATDEIGAVEQLHDMGCTDGLPVIVPTPERVERMVLASGLDGDLVLGTMGPGFGAASVHTIAVVTPTVGGVPLPDEWYTVRLVGSLGALGDFVASLVAPPASPPGLAGATLYHAFAALDPGTLDVELVSNAVELALLR